MTRNTAVRWSFFAGGVVGIFSLYIPIFSFNWFILFSIAWLLINYFSEDENKKEDTVIKDEKRSSIKGPSKGGE